MYPHTHGRHIFFILKAEKEMEQNWKSFVKNTDDDYGKTGKKM